MDKERFDVIAVHFHFQLLSGSLLLNMWQLNSEGFKSFARLEVRLKHVWRYFQWE